jgi:hypothetical protein
LISSSLALAPPAASANAESASQNRGDFIAFFPPELAYVMVKAAMLFHFGLTHKRYAGLCRGTLCSQRQRDSIHFGCSASHSAA